MATVTSGGPAGRLEDVRSGVRVEVVSFAWMLVEAAVGIGAGVAAHSVLLTAFGLDSVIELVTGGVLLWRLRAEAVGRPMAAVERAERVSAWVVGVGLALLCAYVVAFAAWGLISRAASDASPLGIALAVAALGIMPVLARRKRAIADRIGSAALRGDAACSVTCAYMAATLLVGLALHALLGWEWAEGVAAFALLLWLVREAREALEGARAGRAACSCGDDDCEG